MIYPTGEVVWLTARDEQGQVLYIVTSAASRSEYRLYTPAPEGGWQRWGRDASAGNLVRRFELRRA